MRVMGEELSPVYVHNCNKCIFLGTVDSENTKMDLYWCVSNTMRSLDSLIARYGNEGSNYASYHPPDAFAYPEQATQQLRRHAHYEQLMVRGIKAKLYEGRFSYLFRGLT